MSKKMATNFIGKMDFWNLKKNAKDEKKKWKSLKLFLNKPKSRKLFEE